jgi:hypothetical protein
VFSLMIMRTSPLEGTILFEARIGEYNFLQRRLLKILRFQYLHLVFPWVSHDLDF